VTPAQSKTADTDDREPAGINKTKDRDKTERTETFCCCASMIVSPFVLDRNVP
jgi:hypothetical protein